LTNIKYKEGSYLLHSVAFESQFIVSQGIYDIIAKINSDTEEKLKELISERIRSIDRITGTVTVIIAKEIEERKQ